MGIKCFLLEETPKLRRYLRRFQFSDKRTCSKTGSYCNAMAEVEGTEAPVREYTPHYAPDLFSGDSRWPTKCDACGEPFHELDDEYQIFTKRVYRRTDTGEEMTWEDAPAGAMRYCWWISRDRTAGFNLGPDGECLMVKLPDGHEWIVDSRASNCTLPDDNEHKCWVRHGTPPNITVDKNGKTCAAGAGSIQTPKWHGFLRNGELVT